MAQNKYMTIAVIFLMVSNLWLLYRDACHTKTIEGMSNASAVMSSDNLEIPGNLTVHGNIDVKNGGTLRLYHANNTNKAELRNDTVATNRLLIPSSTRVHIKADAHVFGALDVSKDVRAHQNVVVKNGGKLILYHNNNTNKAQLRNDLDPINRLVLHQGTGFFVHENSYLKGNITTRGKLEFKE